MKKILAIAALSAIFGIFGVNASAMTETEPADALSKSGTVESAVYAAKVKSAGGTEKGFASLAEALSAAQNGETVELVWNEGDAPIVMKGEVFGKTVTITGTAAVDWNQGNLFVGRGGEGNGTVIFDNANLTSASDSASYGIHVSGREKGTTNKYDGTLVIKNSTIVLDYLINRGTINVDKSNLTVKKGFGIAGRPASETESGNAATAVINITNGSYVKVLNHNGMGVGVASSIPEGNGILNLTDSTFECDSFNIDAKLGEFNVYGESTIKINTLTGTGIALHHNAIINDSTVGGNVTLYGKVTFRGDNTFNMLYDYGNAYSKEYAEWIIEKGASVTLTEKARYGLGYGDKLTVYGSLEDALTARDTLTEEDRSLFTHGLVAMSNWDVPNSLIVKDAYVVIGSNNSFGNSPSSSHKGTYDIDFENAVLDASRITFYSANSKTDFSFVDSDVKVGTFMTRDADSTFTLTNTKFLSTTATNGTDEGNYHAGTLILNNSDLSYTAPLVMENGTLTLGVGSSLTAPVITGTGKLIIDATDMTAGTVAAISADVSGFTGTLEVVNNAGVEAVIENGAVVLVEKPELPTATVTELKDTNLTFAMNFHADDAEPEQIAYYGDWYADFVLTVNKDVTFNANGGADGYLSGQYDEWPENWVNVPFKDVTIKAGESLKIMEYASELMGKPGLKYTYGEVYEVVKDFDCGVYFTGEYLAKNPDLKVTLELRMYNPDNEEESYPIGEVYEFAAVTEETEIFGNPFYIHDMAIVNGNYQLGVFAGIDSLNYREVGFDIESAGVPLNVPIMTVYESVTAGDRTVTAKDDVKQWRIFGSVVQFPSEYDDTPIYVTPYAKKLNGDKVRGWTFEVPDIYTEGEVK